MRAKSANRARRLLLRGRGLPPGDLALPPAPYPGERAQGPRLHAPPVPHRHEHRGGQAGLPQPHPVLAAAQGDTF